jgi:hypothetical protein
MAEEGRKIQSKKDWNNVTIPKGWNKAMFVFHYREGKKRLVRKVRYITSRESEQLVLYRTPGIKVRFSVNTTWSEMWMRFVSYVDKYFKPPIFDDRFWTSYSYENRRSDHRAYVTAGWY